MACLMVLCWEKSTAAPFLTHVENYHEPRQNTVLSETKTAAIVCISFFSFCLLSVLFMAVYFYVIKIGLMFFPGNESITFILNCSSCSQYMNIYLDWGCV